MPENKPKTCSALEKRFCAIYVSNGNNGTRAYMAIRPRASEASARQSASEWLAKAHIQAEVNRIVTEGLKRAQASADQVLTEMAHLGFSDIGNCTWKPGERDSAGNETIAGTLKPLYEMAPEVRRTIKSIRFDNNGRPEITMWSDKGALTNLAKHHKLIGSDVNINIQLGFSERLRAAREKRLKGGK